MRRRHIEEDIDNHDRWLVSYADFISLLFAFFVVMYSISSVNQGKYSALTNSLGDAFSGVAKPLPSKQKNAAAVNGTDNSRKKGSHAAPSFIKPLQMTQLHKERVNREREKMTNMALNLSSALSPLIHEGKINVIQNNRGVRIDIHDSLLFAPGSAELSAAALTPLNGIAKVLLESPNAIEVEGHTDNTPIHNNTFFSNWELSAVRASSLVRMLNDAGIAENRLSATGYGAARPVSDNDTAIGKSKNRRVSIMILYETRQGNNADGSEIKSE